MTVLGKQDVLAGIFMVLVGGFFLWVGSGYSLGSARNMGPGYFPVILSGGLVAAGLLIAVKGLLANGERLRRETLRPLFAVLGSVVIFAALIDSLGFIAAAVGAVCVAAFARTDTRWRETLVYAAALAAAGAALFIYALGLPMQLIEG